METFPNLMMETISSRLQARMMNHLRPSIHVTPTPHRLAFTLIELLVVISIVALLIAILLPVLTSARSAARNAACLSNERQFGVAWTAYATDNSSFVPHGMDSSVGSGILANYWFRAVADYTDYEATSLIDSGPPGSMLDCPENARDWSDAPGPTIPVAWWPTYTSYGYNTTAFGAWRNTSGTFYPSGGGAAPLVQKLRNLDLVAPDTYVLADSAGQWEIQGIEVNTTGYPFRIDFRHVGDSANMLIADGSASTVKFIDIDRPDNSGAWTNGFGDSF